MSLHALIAELLHEFITWPSQAFHTRNLVSDPLVGISSKKVFVEWIKINGLETFLAARRGEGVLKLG